MELNQADLRSWMYHNNISRSLICRALGVSRLYFSGIETCNFNLPWTIQAALYEMFGVFIHPMQKRKKKLPYVNEILGTTAHNGRKQEVSHG